MSDLAVVGRDAQLGMPGARLLGPALGNLHLFFHRLGPVLARRLLLTGDTVTGGRASSTSVCSPRCATPTCVADRTERWAAKVARMPADGLAIAKTGFNLVEQTQAYVGEEATGFLRARLRHQPPLRGRRVQLREGPGEARHERGVPAPRRALRGRRTRLTSGSRYETGGQDGDHHRRRLRVRACHRRPLRG